MGRTNNTMKQYSKIGNGIVDYSIGELINMIDDPQTVHKIVGAWAFRSITKKEKAELCDLLAREVENKGGE